jgi:hypothetical protein
MLAKLTSTEMVVSEDTRDISQLGGERERAGHSDEPAPFAALGSDIIRDGVEGFRTDGDTPEGIGEIDIIQLVGERQLEEDSQPDPLTPLGSDATRDGTQDLTMDDAEQRQAPARDPSGPFAAMGVTV